MGEYTYKVTQSEMEALYGQMGTIGLGGQFAGNDTANDTIDKEPHKSSFHELLDRIKDRNHAEQGHPS